MERAFGTYIKAVQFDKMHPELTEGATGPEFSELEQLITVISQREKCGNLICVVRPGLVISKLTSALLQANPLIVVRCMIWVFRSLSFNPDVQVCGLVNVMFLGDLSFWDGMTFLNAATMEHRKLAIKYLQECTGIRLKGIYIFKEPMVLKALFNVIYYALSAKMRERFHLCGDDYSKLLNVAPSLAIFPRCLGGELVDGPTGGATFLIAMLRASGR